MVILWAFLLAIVLVGYGILMAMVLPRSLLKTGYATTKPTDRGLKNVKEVGGRSIVYEPMPKYRKYVKQYILSKRNGRKIIILKLDEKIKYLDFDVVMFNQTHEVFKVLNVKELIERPGYTDEIEIPDDVTYVNLKVNEVDGVIIPGKIVKPVSKGKLSTFVLAGIGATVVVIVLIKILLSQIFGGVFRESFLISGSGTVVTLVITGVVILVNALFAVISILVKNGKKVDEGERK